MKPAACVVAGCTRPTSLELNQVCRGVDVLQYARIVQLDDAHSLGVLLQHRLGASIAAQRRELRPESAAEQHRMAAFAL